MRQAVFCWSAEDLRPKCRLYQICAACLAALILTQAHCSGIKDVAVVKKRGSRTLEPCDLQSNCRGCDMGPVQPCQKPAGCPLGLYGKAMESTRRHRLNHNPCRPERNRSEQLPEEGQSLNIRDMVQRCVPIKENPHEPNWI